MLDLTQIINSLSQLQQMQNSGATNKNNALQAELNEVQENFQKTFQELIASMTTLQQNTSAAETADTGPIALGVVGAPVEELVTREAAVQKREPEFMIKYQGLGKHSITGQRQYGATLFVDGEPAVKLGPETSKEDLRNKIDLEMAKVRASLDGAAKIIATNYGTEKVLVSPNGELASQHAANYYDQVDKYYNLRAIAE